MKFSSILTAGLVLIAFVAIQSWVLARTFIAPRVFTAFEASIEGDTVDVRTPIQGMIRNVLVQENQRVQEDQVLFTITRIVTDPATLAWRHDDLPILAVQPGIVTKVDARTGLFVQADQKLATIVDNSPETMRIRAVLDVDADDAHRIRPGMAAGVTAKFLNGGDVIDALVASVDPVYDAYAKRLTVELRLLRYPEGIETMPLGLPVEAWVQQERKSNDNVVIGVYTWLFPHSRAGN
ncbi:MAG: HlyD family efflux transporter periplasmic adaptor subunit [Candidatus Peribacteraceae bacterium]|nr:HlyD family efflux transporter periplasmic adaptor subunit [Candidatus Peribacteraceae bacterium]